MNSGWAEASALLGSPFLPNKVTAGSNTSARGGLFAAAAPAMICRAICCSTEPMNRKQCPHTQASAAGRMPGRAQEHTHCTSNSKRAE